MEYWSRCKNKEARTKVIACIEARLNRKRAELPQATRKVLANCQHCQDHLGEAPFLGCQDLLAAFEAMELYQPDEVELFFKGLWPRLNLVV